MKKELIFLIVAVVALFDLGLVAYKLLKPEPQPEQHVKVQVGGHTLTVEKK